MAKKKITATYAEAIKELEQILERLRSGNVEIDELPLTVKRANDLIEHCRMVLFVTKNEIDKIISAPL